MVQFIYYILFIFFFNLLAQILSIFLTQSSRNPQGIPTSSRSPQGILQIPIIFIKLKKMLYFKDFSRTFQGILEESLRKFLQIMGPEDSLRIPYYLVGDCQILSQRISASSHTLALLW
jgi:hypothetical protein